MKQTRFYLLFVLALLSLGILYGSSCKKGGSSATTETTTATTTKKGASFNTNNTNGAWNSDIVELKAFWYYTWGTPIPSDSPVNAEFVPMFWGSANVTDANIAAVTQLGQQGKVKYVLGFNEPDRPDQANMTVSQALALWPKLESIGLPLGSPATSWPTLQWNYDFLDSAKAEGLRVDFICVHMYVGTDDGSFVQTLQALYTKYHLPIWVTEFATADYNATTPSSNMYTPAETLAFMQRLLPQLDSLSYVQRYAWFSGDPNSSALWTSALVSTNGSLTTLGSWYADYQPNSAIKN